jgi:hypothetical protein
MEARRLESIRKEMLSTRHQASTPMLRELVGLEKKNIEYEDILSKLIGPLHTIRNFQKTMVPTPPTDMYVEMEWKALWESVRLDTAPLRALPTPSPRKIAQFSKQVDDAFVDKSKISQATHAFAVWFRDQAMEHEGLSSMAQAFLGRLLCCRVFFSSNLVLEDQHSALLLNFYRLIGHLGMYAPMLIQGYPTQC